MAELADAPDLGSGVYDVQVQVLLSAGTEALRRNPVGRDILGAFLFHHQRDRNRVPAVAVCVVTGVRGKRQETA